MTILSNSDSSMPHWKASSCFSYQDVAVAPWQFYWVTRDTRRRHQLIFISNQSSATSIHFGRRKKMQIVNLVTRNQNSETSLKLWLCSVSCVVLICKCQCGQFGSDSWEISGGTLSQDGMPAAAPERCRHEAARSAAGALAAPTVC